MVHAIRAMTNVTGMVQVAGRTYRVARLKPRLYEVTRLLDDVVVGLFFPGPPLEIVSFVDRAEMNEVSLAAVRNAKTSWSSFPSVR